MSLYILSYDLRKKRDYDTLKEALAEFGAVSILESDWCFKRINTSADELRNYFQDFIDGDDGLFVAEMTDWAGVGVLGSPNDIS